MKTAERIHVIPRDQSIVRDLTLREKQLDLTVARHRNKLDETIEIAATRNYFSWDISAVAEDTIRLMGYNKESDSETYSVAFQIAIHNAVRAWSNQQSILIRNSVMAKKHKKPF